MNSAGLSGRRRVVLSVDYELFGNGTGDVRQHVVEPTERMARLAERHGVPLVIFVEVEEYLAFERQAGELAQALGYDPARCIREQVRDLARRGHDVQLHLHPQWHGARWTGGRWQLNETKVTVDSLFETEGEVVGYIADRKRVLEEMAGLGPGRRVVAYRAGAFSAQPGAKLLAGLAANGFALDSSVVKGLVWKDGFGGYDYRGAPSARDPWRVSEDVAVADPQGPLWEVPIYSVMGRRLHQATWDRLRAKFSKHVPKAQKKDVLRQLGVGRSPVEAAKFLWQPVPIKLDFHNLSPGAFMRMVRDAPPPAEGLPEVLVAIGHSKEHINDRSFGRLLELLAREPGLEVVTFTEVARLLAAAGNKAARSQARCKP